METFSALLAICAGNSPVPGEFPTQRPVTRSFDVYFDLRPNKWLSKQSWGWWFETLSCSLWRHRNDLSNVRGACSLIGLPRNATNLKCLFWELSLCHAISTDLIFTNCANICTMIFLLPTCSFSLLLSQWYQLTYIKATYVISWLTKFRCLCNVLQWEADCTKQVVAESFSSLGMQIKI